MFKLKILATAALLAVLATPAVQAVTVTPTLTATVSDSGGGSDYQDSNGNWPYLTVNWSDGWENVGLLQFDLSSFGTTNAGTLRLYHLFNEGQDASFSLYRNTSAWIGTVSSWSTRPSFDAAPVATLDFIAGTYSQGAWYALDVSTAVAGWTSGSYANYGFTLARTDAPNPILYFGGNTSGFVPELVLGAVPEPSSYLLMAAGLLLLNSTVRKRAA